jgi:hypothetical protein
MFALHTRKPRRLIAALVIALLLLDVPLHFFFHLFRSQIFTRAHLENRDSARTLLRRRSLCERKSLILSVLLVHVNRSLEKTMVNIV